MSVHYSISGSLRPESNYAFSDQSASGLNHLIHAADEHQRRSLRLFHTLQRVAEVEREKQQDDEERAARRSARLEEIEKERRHEADLRRQAAELASEKRQAKLEAAARADEHRREQARSKILSEDRRTEKFVFERQKEAERKAAEAARLAARREAFYQAKQDVVETKREQCLAKMKAAAETLRKHKEEQDAERDLKAQEDLLRQKAREETKRRAEEEQELKTTQLLLKAGSKDEALKQRQRELEKLRRMKAKAAQERAEYVELQAYEAQEKDAAMREELRKRLEEKATHVDAMNAERAALAQQLARARNSMQLHESAVRKSLQMLRQKGSDFSMPKEITETLQGLGLSSYYPRASTMISSSHDSALTREPLKSQSLGPSQIGSRKTLSGRLKASGGSSQIGSSSGNRPQSALERGSGAHKAMITGRDVHVDEGMRHGVPQTEVSQAPLSPAARREEELRQVLREEIDKETERQAILSGVNDQRELARLHAVFTAERQEAKKRILGLSDAVKSGILAEAAVSKASAETQH